MVNLRKMFSSTHLSFNYSIQWWRFYRFAQKMTNGSQPQQLYTECQLVQWSSEHLRCHVFIKSVESCSCTQVKAESRTNSASTTFTLLQIGTRSPHSGIAGHVIVRCKELHFCLATVDYVHYVVDRYGRFSNIGGKNYLHKEIYYLFKTEMYRVQI